MRRRFLSRSIVTKALRLHASMFVALVFVLGTGGCSSAPNPANPSPTPPTATLPNVEGTWTLVMTTTTPSRPYSSFGVTLVQRGTTLTGSILPLGTTRSTSISLGSVSSGGQVTFGSEHAWWNDVGDTVGSDLYVHLTLDSTGNRMTGSCRPGACGTATATRADAFAPTPSPVGSSMSATIDGVPWTAASILVNRFPGFAPKTTAFIFGGRDASVLRGVTIGVGFDRPLAPGTYPMNAAANANTDQGTALGLLQWSTGFSPGDVGGSGSVVVTAFTASTLSGTFSFVAVPIPGTNTTGTKTVTNGTFNIAY